MKKLLSMLVLIFAIASVSAQMVFNVNERTQRTSRATIQNLDVTTLQVAETNRTMQHAVATPINERTQRRIDYEKQRIDMRGEAREEVRRGDERRNEPQTQHISSEMQHVNVKTLQATPLQDRPQMPHATPQMRRVQQRATVDTDAQSLLRVAPPQQDRVARAPIPGEVIYSQGFEDYWWSLPTGWTMIGGNWQIAGFWDNPPHTGWNALFTNWEGQPNAWVFSADFALEANVTYIVSFWFQAPGWFGAPDDLFLYIGQDRTENIATSGTLIFSQEGYPGPGAWTLATTTFTPAIGGNFNLAFHAPTTGGGFGFFVYIDDVLVRLPDITRENDLAVTAVMPGFLTQIPVSQTVPLVANVTNVGLETQTNIILSAEHNDVDAGQSAPLPALAPFTTETMTITPPINPIMGANEVVFTVAQYEVDEDPNDNTATIYFRGTHSTFAMDNEYHRWSLGWENVLSFIGNIFTITEEVQIGAISAAFLDWANSDIAGVTVCIRPIIGGIIQAPIVISEPFTRTAEPPGWMTIPITSTTLVPGDYFVSVKQPGDAPSIFLAASLQEVGGPTAPILAGDDLWGWGDSPVGPAFIRMIEDVNCPPPTSLAVLEITTGTARLDWEGLAGDRGFRVELLWNNRENVWGFYTSQTFATVAGLSSEVEYEWRVISFCGATPETVWGDPFTTLPCETVTTFPWIENFAGETFPPACWTLITENAGVDVTWERNDMYPTAPGTIAHARHPNTSFGEQQISWLITEPIKIPDTDAVFYLSFWNKFKFLQYDFEGTHGVWISTTDNDTESFEEFLPLIRSDAGEWREIVVSLEEFADETIYLAFKIDVPGGHWATGWYVSDIRVALEPLVVLEKEPYPGEINVPTDAEIIITFNQDIFEGDFDLIEIYPAVNGIQASIVDNTTLVIAHEGFEYLTEYLITIPAGTVTCLGGGLNPEIMFVFMTASYETLLVSKVPHEYAIGVNPDVHVVVTFNRPIAEYTYFDDITITYGTGSVFPTTVEIEYRSIIITHAGFEYDTEYTVYIPEGAIENFDEEITWTFTTRSEVLFTERSPLPATVGVLRATPVYVVFNQNIIAGELEDITIYPPLMPITPSIWENTLIIDVSRNGLVPGTEFTITIPTTAIFGLNNEIEWTFTTEDAKIFPVPFFENFAETYPVGPNGLPDWWTVSHGEGGWQIYDDFPGVVAPIERTMLIDFEMRQQGEDAWAFSPHVALETGVTYEISFWYLAPGFSWFFEMLDDFRVHIGREPNATSMEDGTLVFEKIGLPHIREWTQVRFHYTASATGVHHLGFQNLTAAYDGNFVVIDAVSIRVAQENSLEIMANFPYTQIPTSQFPTVSAQAMNIGTEIQTNVRLSGTLNTLPIGTSEPVASLVTFEVSPEMTITPIVPVTLGDQTMVLTVAGDQTNQGDFNTTTIEFYGSENVFAVDALTAPNPEGVGFHFGGTMANVFEITEATMLSEVQIFFSEEDPFWNIYYMVMVFPMIDPLTASTTAIATSDILTRVPGISTVDFSGDNVLLLPGLHAVAITSPDNVMISHDNRPDGVWYSLTPSSGEMERFVGGQGFGSLGIRMVIDDEVPIVVTAKTPAPGATNVVMNAEVKVTFHQEVTAGDLAGITITYNGGAGTVSGVSGSVAGRYLTIAHGGFVGGTEYTVTVPIGAIVDFDAPITWTFTTAPRPDEPIDLAVDVEGTTATFTWDQLTSLMATITLEAGDVWGDGSGYQMLLDNTATLFGTVIPENDPLTWSCTGIPADLYDAFSHRIPENADPDCWTSNIVINNSITIEVEAGIFDFMITNPEPGGQIWIAGGPLARQDDFEFEAGMHYTFTAVPAGYEDLIELEITPIIVRAESFNVFLDGVFVENVTDTFRVFIDLAPGDFVAGVQAVSARGALSDIVTFPFTVGDATRVRELETGVIAIYPNPVDDILHISTTELVRRIEIFNTQGTMVIATENIRPYINVSHLPAGVYMIRFITETGVSTQRFVKR